MIGHLMECAAQVTGGYFADPEYKNVNDLAAVGFPIAEVQPDGAAIVTKLDGTGVVSTFVPSRNSYFMRCTIPLVI